MLAQPDGCSANALPAADDFKRDSPRTRFRPRAETSVLVIWSPLLLRQCMSESDTGIDY